MDAKDSIFSQFNKRLEGKVALITGGASGIGETMARVFAKHGAKVAIVDIQDELGKSVVESIGSAVSIYIHCDVTNEEHVRTAVDTAVLMFGKLDIMVANAGIVDPNQRRIMEYEQTHFERILKVNVTGVFLCMKHAARVMVPTRSGCIISTASACSVSSAGATHAYTCSKHAVVGLTKNLAVELGEAGIRVNCVSPHAIATPLSMKFLSMTAEEVEAFVAAGANLKGSVLETEDVAYAALYLASNESKFVSGHNLVIDGGFSLLNSSYNIFKNTDKL